MSRRKRLACYKMGKMERIFPCQRRKFSSTFQVLLIYHLVSVVRTGVLTMGVRILPLEHHSLNYWVQSKRLDYSIFKVLKYPHCVISNYYSAISSCALEGDSLQSFGF